MDKVTLDDIRVFASITEFSFHRYPTPACNLLWNFVGTAISNFQVEKAIQHLEALPKLSSQRKVEIKLMGELQQRRRKQAEQSKEITIKSGYFVKFGKQIPNEFKATFPI